MLSGIWGLPDAEAATQGYSDAGQNFVTGTGVVGANYTGTVGCAIYGSTTGAGTDAIFGEAHNDGSIGVRGIADGTSGMALYGYAGGAGYTYGVYGESSSTTGTGVYGVNKAAAGTTYGVWGASSSSTFEGCHRLPPAGESPSLRVWQALYATLGFNEPESFLYIDLPVLIVLVVLEKSLDKAVPFVAQLVSFPAQNLKAKLQILKAQLA